jgi:5-methylcytosine-specific restriction endonuclease McrA
MKNSLKEQVLILNKSWTPIRLKTLQTAIKLIFSDRADIVDKDYSVWSWDDWSKRPYISGDFIQTTSSKIILPEIIILKKYNKIPVHSVRYSKRNIFIRDQYNCQYSGKKVDFKTADIDHIIPKSKGGKDCWENVVVCAKEINRKKADNLPEDVGLKLLKTPTKPNPTTLFIDPKIKIKDSWRDFLKL